MPADFRLLETGDFRLVETGDFRILESSTADNVIDLPLIDGGTMFPPSTGGDVTIDLPLLDGGQILAPDLIPDQLLTLPLADGGQTFGPVTTSPQDFTLPLIDGGAIYAPDVLGDQDADLPLLDGGQVLAPSFVQDETLTVPLIDGGWAFGPDVAGAVTAGLAVYAVVGGGDDVLLEPVTTPTFRDPIDDIGSFTLVLANDDPNLALVDFDAVVAFQVDGRYVFRGVVEKRVKNHLAPGEEHDHVTTITGPGFLGIASRDVVYPSRGVGALPIEDVRSWSWVSPDFDASHWPFAKKINLQRSYAFFDGIFVGSAGPVPHIWPDTTGWWIWANRADCTRLDAPVGTCLFRDTFTLSSAKTVRIFVAFDNRGKLYIDGAQVADFAGFHEGQYIDVRFSAGEHVIAAATTNDPATGDYNPGGVIWAGCTLSGMGLLDDLIFHTDAGVRCLPYPATPPGFTPGEVLYQIKAETDIFDGVTFDFTETLDSAGRPWTEYPEITVQVGRRYVELLREMAGSFIDVAAAPGASVIRAWNKGTRGVDRAATLTQTPGDPDTSEFLQLAHTGQRARLNKALIRYGGGHAERLDQDSIDDVGTRGGFVELGVVQSEPQAQAITAEVMERRNVAAYTSTARILPSSTGPMPYVDFEVGDRVVCLDENGDLVLQRVMAITLDPDEVGVLEWGIELRDIELDLEELHQNWLRRAAEGAAIGGARVTSPAGTPQPSARQIAALDVAEFSIHNLDGDVPTGLGITRRAAKSGNAVEIAATLTLVDDGVPTSTATTFYVYLDGDVLGSLVTVPAGTDEAEIPLARVPVRANLDRLRPELVSVASEVAGLDIQVRAL